MAENLNLKKTILIEDKEYNINAVYSDEAGKVTTPLVIKESLATGEQEGSYNGDATDSTIKEINYVPATGGAFNGPVQININNKSVEGVGDYEIINRGQMETVIAQLDGAPLYTWDASIGYNAVKNDKEEDYRLNTVIGKVEDLPVFEAYSSGQAHNKYITPDSYDKAYITYSTDTVREAYFNQAYDNIKNTITKLVFNGDLNPKNKVKIKGNSFINMRSLTSVHLNSGVSELGDSAFSGCASLNSIELPDSVETIGASAFAGCAALTGVVLGSKVTEIKTYTFQGCSNLKSIAICCSKDKIKDLKIDSTAFSGCDNLKKVYFNGTQEDWNKIKPSGAPSTIIPIDGTGFPFLYICKDPDIIDTSLTSNKMFLKLPGEALVEISKGAARLERRDSKTSGNADYFTYDVLAAVIAGINSRITALGSKALAMPETLKVYDSETTAVVNIPTKIANEFISTDSDKALLVEETHVASVTQLQEQITKLTGGTYADKHIVPTTFGEAYELGYDFSGKTLTFKTFRTNDANGDAYDSINYRINFSSGEFISGVVGNSDNFGVIDGTSESIQLGSLCTFAEDIGKVVEFSADILGEYNYSNISATEFSDYVNITFEVKNDTTTDYLDTVVKAKADETNSPIRSSYYQTGVRRTAAKDGNCIRIIDDVSKLNSLDYLEGDIVIVV